MRDFANNVKAEVLVAPAVVSAAADGDSTDLFDCNQVAIVVASGAVAGAGDFAVTLEDSDDDSNFDAVASKFIVGDTLESTITANTVTKVSYVGSKRYVRPTITKAGGTSVALSVTAIKTGLADRPDA